MNEATVKKWFQLVWMQRPGCTLAPSQHAGPAFLQEPHLLGVKEAVRKANMDLVIIPGGTKSQLQPLDVTINKPDGTPQEGFPQ